MKLKSLLLVMTILMTSALLVCASFAHATYWNVFNIEGESSISAQIVTYAGLTDMLTDTNRTGVFTPNPTGFGVNIVGSGSDESPVAPVPEPTTLLLLGTGLVALTGYGRKRRK